MRKLVYFFCFFILASAYSCKQNPKDNNIRNQKISCKITSHAKDSVIENNKETTISAEATGPIQRVEFYFNDVLLDSVNSAPYEIKYRVKDFLPGKGKLSIVAVSESGETCRKVTDVNFKINLKDEYQGGYIISLSENGMHGMIMAKEDLTDAPFGKFVYEYSNKRRYSSDSMEDGIENTNSFRKQYTVNDQTIAAVACIYYRGGGFTDWYLPSAQDVKLFSDYADLIGDMKIDNYRFWSSTETIVELTKAYAFDFEDLSLKLVERNALLRVRPVRKF